MSRVITVSQNSFEDIHTDHQVPRERMHVVPVGVDQELFRPARPTSQRVPGRLITTASADVTMKGLQVPARGPGQAAHRARGVARRHRPQEGGRRRRPAPSTSWACGDCVEFVTGVPEERIIELYSEAEVAVVPVAVRGLLAAGHRGHVAAACPWSPPPAAPCPRWSAPTTRPPSLVPPGDSEALAARIATALDDPELRARIGAAGRQRVIDRWTWRHTAVGTVEHYRALLAETADIQRRRPGGVAAAPRFQPPPTPSHAPRRHRRRRLSRADRRLRQARPPRRRPAARPGLRLRPPRLRGPPPRRPGGGLRHGHHRADRGPQPVRGHGRPPARSPPDGIGDCVNGDATRLPVRRRHLRPHHRQRGDGAHPRRHAARSTSSPGCSSRAARSPSPSRPGCPRRSAGRSPTSTTRPRPSGGHVRIYTEDELRAKMRGAGLEPTAPPTTPTPCTRRTGG